LRQREWDLRAVAKVAYGTAIFSSEYAVVAGSEGWVVETVVLRVSTGTRSSSHATISCKGLKIRRVCNIQGFRAEQGLSMQVMALSTWSAAATHRTRYLKDCHRYVPTRMASQAFNPRDTINWKATVLELEPLVPSLVWRHSIGELMAGFDTTAAVYAMFMPLRGPRRRDRRGDAQRLGRDWASSRCGSSLPHPHRLGLHVPSHLDASGRCLVASLSSIVGLEENLLWGGTW
jgi:hypothetical protein